MSGSKSRDRPNMYSAKIDASYASFLMWISRCLKVSDAPGDRPPSRSRDRYFVVMLDEPNFRNHDLK